MGFFATSSCLVDICFWHMLNLDSYMKSNRKFSSKILIAILVFWEERILIPCFCHLVHQYSSDLICCLVSQGLSANAVYALNLLTEVIYACIYTEPIHMWTCFQQTCSVIVIYILYRKLYCGQEEYAATKCLTREIVKIIRLNCDLITLICSYFNTPQNKVKFDLLSGIFSGC